MAKVGSLKWYLIIIGLLIVFVPPFAKYQELRYKDRKLEEKIAELKAENRMLLDKKQRLQTDVGYIEKKAREKIGVVRRGEIVVKDAAVK